MFFVDISNTEHWQVMKCTRASAFSDLWSLGVVIFMLVTGGCWSFNVDTVVCGSVIEKQLGIELKFSSEAKYRILIGCVLKNEMTI